MSELSARRKRYGYWNVTLHRDGKLIAVRAFDTEKEARAAKARTPKGPGRKVTVQHVPGRESRDA